MRSLTVQQVIALQELLIKKDGGLSGVKDVSLIDASLRSPFQTFDGIDLYPTKIDKIVRTSYNLIRNHCFADGNKRIGVYVLIALLRLNGFEVKLDSEHLIKIGLEVGSGEMSYEAYKTFFEVNYQSQQA